MRKGRKEERREILQSLLLEQPLLTDEELSERLGASVATVRLDRMQLAIPEWRERLRQSLDKSNHRLRASKTKVLVGELLDLKLNHSGLSIMESTEAMALANTRIIRSHEIYAMAESLALAVIDAEVALVGVANIKYRSPALAGERLVAKAELVEDRGNSKLVHVRVSVSQREIFRGKFLLNLII